MKLQLKFLKEILQCVKQATLTQFQGLITRRLSATIAFNLLISCLRKDRYYYVC